MNSERPKFPKRAVITAGMPYGNKELHFGHIGAVFIHADMYARFLKDRLGDKNVVFVSGADCYGSPIVEDFRKKNTDGKYKNIEEFVQQNYENHVKALKAFDVEPSFYGGSGIEPAKSFHEEVCNEMLTILYEKGVLKKYSTLQFYDEDMAVYLNGRQVQGKCPIQGCKSEKAYADECDLGHQYDPSQLIEPISCISGNKPVMVNTENWYFSMENYSESLKEWINDIKSEPYTRPYLVSSIEEFLKDPVIHVKRKFLSLYEGIKSELPHHTLENDEKKPSFTLTFDEIHDREKACEKLKNSDIPFRTGKTLTPFRLTGNVEWGVKAITLEGLDNLTFWVWPESLWAPISFTRTYLEGIGGDWKDFWMSDDAKVYQFIGEDNIYFYGPAEMAMFIAANENMPLPVIIANRHVLFMNKKASSSSDIKPPMALELLEHYKSEQLRAHFLSLGFANKSVSFQPKAYNPDAPESEADPVLKEGKLLSNVFNRIARSCFYTSQKYYDSRIPVGSVSQEIVDTVNKTILEYEMLMYKVEFHNVMSLLDTFIREANKYWVRNIKLSETNNDDSIRDQTLIDTFHLLKCGCILLHPIAPRGTELLKEYLNVTDNFFSWDGIFDTIYPFLIDGDKHILKELPPRFDFF